jgi:hypothetical protein
MKIYQIRVHGGPYPWPYSLGLYAAADETTAIQEARDDHPDLIREGVQISATRVIGIGE